jgi:hypothetical protein
LAPSHPVIRDQVKIHTWWKLVGLKYLHPNILFRAHIPVILTTSINIIFIAHFILSLIIKLKKFFFFLHLTFDQLEIDRLDFDFGDKSRGQNRLDNRVSGKGKKGGQGDSIPTVLWQ